MSDTIVVIAAIIVIKIISNKLLESSIVRSITRTNAKRKCLLILFQNLISELFSFGELHFKYSTIQLMQLMATDTSITPGLILTIIGSVTKHSQLSSKTKMQYSYHFDDYPLN